MPFGEEERERTATKLRDVWGRIVEAFRHDSFPTQPGKLCGWCAHRATCPAFAESGADAAPTP